MLLLAPRFRENPRCACLIRWHEILPGPLHWALLFGWRGLIASILLVWDTNKQTESSATFHPTQEVQLISHYQFLFLSPPFFLLLLRSSLLPLALVSFFLFFFFFGEKRFLPLAPVSPCCTAALLLKVVMAANSPPAFSKICQSWKEEGVGVGRTINLISPAKGFYLARRNKKSRPKNTCCARREAVDLSLVRHDQTRIYGSIITPDNIQQLINFIYFCPFPDIPRLDSHSR